MSVQGDFVFVNLKTKFWVIIEGQPIPHSRFQGPYSEYREVSEWVVSRGLSKEGKESYVEFELDSFCRTTKVCVKNTLCPTRRLSFLYLRRMSPCRSRTQSVLVKFTP